MPRPGLCREYRNEVAENCSGGGFGDASAVQDAA